LVAFWRSVIEHPYRLIEMVDTFTPTPEAFHEAKRRCLHHRGDVPDDPVTLGFEKLVAHRLSHSGRGVQSGSCRGGNHQNGNCTIDGRWSPWDIRRQVPNTSRQMNRLKELRCTNVDFATLIEDESEPCILFLDPPYRGEGGGTYQHSFKKEDHERLAALLQKTKHPWVLTYGNDQEIRRLYEWTKIETVHMESGLTKKYRTDLIITR
jgi:DNA adenine methylase